MPLHLILLDALILAGGSAIQSAAGFGFGLFATTLMLFSGMPAEQAIPLTGAAAIMQLIAAAWHLRSDVQWGTVLRFSVIAIAMQPVGAWLLGQLSAMGPGVVLQVFGCVVFVAVIMQWAIRPAPHERLHPGWGVLAMSVAGLMQGLTGLSGPPVVLWVMAHDWSARRSRAMMFAIFVVIAPTNLINYYIRFGAPALHGAVLGVLFIPAVFIGMMPGMWIGHHTPKHRLRQAAFVILLAVAVYAVAKPLMA